MAIVRVNLRSEYDQAIQLDASGNHEGAASLFRKLASSSKIRDSRKSVFLLLAADSYLSAKIYDEAEAVCHLAVKFDSASAIAHRSLGLVFLESGRPREAALELRKSIELRPTATAHIYLGQSIRSDNLEAAVEHFRSATALDSQSEEAHFHLATSLAELERTEEACAALVKSIEICPDYRPAIQLLLELQRKDCGGRSNGDRSNKPKS